MHREIHFCFWAKHICQILKGRWWISHFRCWTHPEVVNLGADQTDRSVLRWECRMQNNVLTSVCDSSYENTSYPPKCFYGVWGHSESLWKPFWNALQCFSNPFETLWNPVETLWNCGDSRVDPQTTLTMLWRNSLSITGQTHKKLTSICFLRQQIVELPALARWRVARISNSCFCPHIDNKI